MMTAELKNWSVLATRTMNDAVLVIETIDPEDITEDEKLTNLIATLHALVRQGFVLNGVIPQSKLSKQKPRRKAAP